MRPRLAGLVLLLGLAAPFAGRAADDGVTVTPGAAQ